MTDISEKEYRSLVRDSIKLLMEVYANLRSSNKRSPKADALKEQIGVFLSRVKRIKDRADDEAVSKSRAKVDCKHEEPQRIRRIRGNGYSYAWRCHDCWTYLQPTWVKTDAMGKLIEPGPAESNPKDQTPEISQ